MHSEADLRPIWPLIRPNPDHGPDYKDCDQTFQTELTSDQTEIRPWSRILCARTAFQTL